MEDEIKTSTFEAFEGKELHPSLDIQDGLIVLGFRYRTKDRKDADIWVVAARGAVYTVVEDPVVIGEQTFWLDRRSHRKLARLEDRWGNDAFRQYLDEQASGFIKPITSREVFEQLVEFCKNYQEPEHPSDYYLEVAWIIGTYFFPIFGAYPFLHLKAPKGSGKSQTLALLAQLCFNATIARPSLAALGDTVDALRGTYLIDQADSLSKDGREDILDILCGSYKRSGGKRRIVNIEKGRRETLEFDTYSPKAFASIKELPEDLRDRCLVLPLTRSSRTDFADPDDPWMDWRKERAKLYELLISDYVLVDGKYAEQRSHHKHNPTDISGRKLELWLPIETILMCFSTPKITEAAKLRFFAHYGSSEYEPGELEIAVMEALRQELEGKDEKVLAPGDLVFGIPEDSYYGTITTHKQKAAAIGRVITKFNLFSEKLKRTKEGIKYHFIREKVEQVYRSYFGSEPTPHTPTEEVEPPCWDDIGAGDKVQEE